MLAEKPSNSAAGGNKKALCRNLISMCYIQMKEMEYQKKVLLLQNRYVLL